VSLVTVGWIILGLGIVAAVLMLATSWLRRDRKDADLGSVSHQWIAEQRTDHERSR
jgi:uncharacterized protein (TIGR03382 family)